MQVILAKTACIAMIIGLILYVLQFVVAFSGHMPDHQESLANLFFAPEGHSGIAPFMWAAVVFSLVGIALGLPAFRREAKIVPLAPVLLIAACWLDKGLASSLGEFMPNSFGWISDYVVPFNEIAVICGVYAIGLLMMSLLYKVVFSVVKASPESPAGQTKE
ncbi:MAG TPA: hypothetical protein DEB24_07910 [Coriobacteriia bacterium]|nr:hypothetical protein [Coriobacteriia bacterium]